MRAGDPQSGYTLVELLVVIAIVGLIVAIAAPVAATTIASAQFRADAQSAVTLLRRCQSDAVHQSRTITLETPADVAGLAKHDGYKIGTVTELQIEDPIRCFADGTTTGGRLVLRRGARSRTVVVAWLTGTITVE